MSRRIVSRLFPAILAAFLLAGAAASAAAQPDPAPPSSQPDAERMAKALALARTVQSREVAVDQAMEILDRQVVEALLADPEIERMEAEHPGIVKAMWAGARPVLADELVKSLPDLWDRLSRVYARHLTSAQIDEVAAFVESAAGRKLVSEMNRNADVKPMLRDVMRSPEGEIGLGTYLETVGGAASATLAAMTPAEREELIRFFTSPAGRALQAAAPETTGLAVEWMNMSDPETDQRVAAAMEAAIDRFLVAGPTVLRHGEAAPGAAIPG